MEKGRDESVPSGNQSLVSLQLQFQSQQIAEISQKLSDLTTDVQILKALLAQSAKKDDQSLGVSGRTRRSKSTKHILGITMLFLLTSTLLTYLLLIHYPVSVIGHNSLSENGNSLEPYIVIFPGDKKIFDSSILSENTITDKSTVEPPSKPASIEEPSIISSSDSDIFVKRNMWHARPSVGPTKRLNHPVPLVIIIHTATPMCSESKQCMSKVKSYQDYHVAERGYPDIGYNFLIGGDGKIYEGLGWDTVNFSRDNSISIAFIGNFVYDYLTPEMITAAKTLLDEGLQSKMLSEDYMLVCHNQTKNTLSPGVNVYKVVKNWPHFKSGKV